MLKMIWGKTVPAPQCLSTLLIKSLITYKESFLGGRWRQTIKKASGWSIWRSWLDISALLCWAGMMSRRGTSVILQRFLFNLWEAEGEKELTWKKAEMGGENWQKMLREKARESVNHSLNLVVYNALWQSYLPPMKQSSCPYSLEAEWDEPAAADRRQVELSLSEVPLPIMRASMSDEFSIKAGFVVLKDSQWNILHWQNERGWRGEHLKFTRRPFQHNLG